MNDTTDIMRAGIWATGQHTFIYCMFIYGLTQASGMLFHTTSYGLAAASLIQMVLLPAAYLTAFPGFTEEQAVCGLRYF